MIDLSRESLDLANITVVICPPLPGEPASVASDDSAYQWRKDHPDAALWRDWNPSDWPK